LNKLINKYRRNNSKLLAIVQFLLIFQISFHVHPIDIAAHLFDEIKVEHSISDSHSPVGCAIIFHSNERSEENSLFDKIVVLFDTNQYFENPQKKSTTNFSLTENKRGPPEIVIN